ncbi:MAG: hypothetical protein RIQ53_342 [Pseudomonadota bacterium]
MRRPRWLQGPQGPRPSRRHLRPTPAGACLLLLVGVLLLMAINEANNLLYALAFLLLSVLGMATLQTALALRGLRLTALEAPPVHAGDTGLLSIRVDAGPRARHGLRLSLAAQAPGPVAAAQPVDDLPAGGSVVLSLRWPAGTRGWQSLPGLQVETTQPLGLARARLRQAAPLQRLVWPRPADAGPQRAAAARARQAAGGQDFSGLSSWQAGDSPRRLHWRAWARGGPPMVKRFDGEAGAEAVRLDWQSVGGDAEQRLSLLTRRLLDIDAARQPWLLQLPGSTPVQGPGSAARLRALARLALHRPGAGRDGAEPT